jgi:hypothetical protein
MTVTPALVVRRSWWEIFEVFELLAFQLVSTPPRSAWRLSARSFRSTAVSVEPESRGWCLLLRSTARQDPKG